MSCITVTWVREARDPLMDKGHANATSHFKAVRERIFLEPQSSASQGSTTMVTLTRSRLPSFDVQRDTRAALAAASESKRLPVSFADIGGLIVTEKNTFINIAEASEEFFECDQDLYLDEVSPVLPLRHDRKKTQGVILSAVRERAMSSFGGSARQRRRSCPPELWEDELLANLHFTGSSGGIVSPPATPVVRSRRHYSIDFNHHMTPSNTSPSSPLKPVDETSASTLPATPTEQKSTVMLRNVPYSEGQNGVLSIIEERGFSGRFDFFYAPLDFSSGNNLGYAFINLPDAEAVSEFFAVFDGLRVDKDGWSQKDLQVCWARVQGRDPNVEHYRNSPVNDMPESFRPMIFDAAGNHLLFPRPDENVPRRPIPTTSMYSGNRAANRPRFASANFPTFGMPNTAARRRNQGSFTSTRLPL